MVVRNNFEEVSPHFKTSYLTIYPKNEVIWRGIPRWLVAMGVVKM